jgi:hypothetical protein
VKRDLRCMEVRDTRGGVDRPTRFGIGRSDRQIPKSKGGGMSKGGNDDKVS